MRTLPQFATAPFFFFSCLFGPSFFVFAGDDGLEGAIDELDDCRVMFGYVRCIMPDGRPKFVAITWAGPSADEQQKGKIQTYKGQVRTEHPKHLNDSSCVRF